MVAYSGLVNDDVRSKCKEAGFTIVIESPVTVDNLKEFVLTRLAERSENISIVKQDILKSS